MYRGPLTDLTSNKCSYERKLVPVEARSSGVDFEHSGESGIGREAGADIVPRRRRLLLSMFQICRESQVRRRELCMRCMCQNIFWLEDYAMLYLFAVWGLHFSSSSICFLETTKILK
ncbi:hypothetical protein IscW_ISCW003615 [Ixodes scapularis]|uniref:Uncharacterized protein n=1 Tax=Ixodes scapularis TaxID=6945 RepID=B7PHY8_IXOSC|nr:hypothetical protein IscW_ISCW003615 [Ixodes scapularis]|eukprot:XP_002403849.1 hypothetical protein IscW_ISCW003615 [Ixodes scapularis]